MLIDLARYTYIVADPDLQTKNIRIGILIFFVDFLLFT